jgi:hypothetical protein
MTQISGVASYKELQDEIFFLLFHLVKTILAATVSDLGYEAIST